MNLTEINVNEHTESKNGLTYLSWAWAWAEVLKVCPDATYEVVKFDGLPYAHDPETGYMVYTTVTIDGVTREMWLPVMDYKNKAMLNATMFDINKAIMRCLTKNLAMFGLGLYIYAGEDLPEPPQDVSKRSGKEFKPAPKKPENGAQSTTEAYAEVPTSFRIKVQELSGLNKTRADECAAWVLEQVKAGSTTGEIMDILQKAIDQEMKGGK